jgi:hypothetical protein
VRVGFRLQRHPAASAATQLTNAFSADEEPDHPRLHGGEFWDQYDMFIKEVGARIRDGSIHYREDIVDGFENTPSAFAGMLRGENFGKLIIRVSD